MTLAGSTASSCSWHVFLFPRASSLRVRYRAVARRGGGARGRRGRPSGSRTHGHASSEAAGTARTYVGGPARHGRWSGRAVTRARQRQHSAAAGRYEGCGGLDLAVSRGEVADRVPGSTQPSRRDSRSSGACGVPESPNGGDVALPV
jgi:hypothetical protein